MHDRRIALGLRAFVATGAVLAVTGSALLVATGHGRAAVGDFYLQFSLLAVFYAAFVWIVAPRQPRNAVVWIMATAVLFGVWVAGRALAAAAFPGEWSAGSTLDFYVLQITPDELPRSAAWVLFFTAPGTFPALILPISLGLLWFPDGRLPSPRWRGVAWFTAASVAAATSVGAWSYRPWSEAIPEQGVAFEIAFVMATGAVLLCFVALVGRYRRSVGKTRQQLRWVMLGATSFVAAFMVGYVFGRSSLGYVLYPFFAVAVVALPIAYGMALGRFKLYDVELAVNRTLVFAALAFFITGVYSVLVAGVGRVVGGSSIWWSIAATTLVALCFEPVRAAVQRRVNRLVYGTRATPYEVLGDLTRRLSSAESLDGLLERMVEQLAAGTGAVRAIVWLGGGDGLEPRAAAPAGPVPHEPAGVVIPIEHGGEILGALSVEKRRSEALTPQEHRLVADLAASAALVLRRIRLDAELSAKADELARSRRRLAGAQATELARLRRTLHEGVRREVGELTDRVAAVAALASAEGSSATAALADQIAEDGREAVRQIDELSRGMRPQSLDSVGLAAALQTIVDGSPQQVRLEVAELPALDADAEAAVFYTISEALTNAAKHGADPVTVDLATDGDRLTFSVVDSGPGFDPEVVSAGSGLGNMVERIRVAGGALEMDSAPGRATRVTGWIPVAAAVGAPTR